MSENTSVNGVRPTEKPTLVIARVHNQLLNDFHPAVKKVAQNGLILEKALGEVARASAAYIESLQELSSSGKAGEKPTQAQAQRLEKVANSLKLINAAHNKCAKEFSQLSRRIHTNNEKEKDRLKDLKEGFMKNEKAAQHALKKGQKGKSDVEKFYTDEAANLTSQQAKRYQFFAEKHEEMTKNYGELGKLMAKLLAEEKEDGEADRKENDNHVETSPKIAHRSEKSISSSVTKSEIRSESLPSSKKRESDALLPKTFGLEVETNHRDDEVGAKELDAPRHTKSTSEDHAVNELQELVANNMQKEDTMLPIHVKSQSDISQNFILAPKDTSRQVDQYSPIERQRQFQQPPPRQPAQDYPPYQPMAPQYQPPQAFQPPPPASQPYQPPMDQIYQTPYVQIDTRPIQPQQSPNGHVDVIGNPRYVPAPPPPPKRQESDAYSPNYYQQNQQMQPAAYSPPIAPRSHSSQPPPMRPSPHVITHDQEVKPLPRPIYQPTLITQVAQPAMQPKPVPSVKPAAPPPFTTSDYGRDMECTVSYTGTATNQLSLDAGERVTLIKCGNRGWVLARTQDSTRTGWFPGKFLRLI